MKELLSINTNGCVRLLSLLVCGLNLLEVPLPCAAKVISGGVQHIEKLDRLDSKLKPDGLYSEDPKSDFTECQWIEIPTWLAGTWRSIQVAEVEDANDSSTNTATRILSSKEIESLGLQLDAKKMIWTMSYPLSQFVRVTNATTKTSEEQKEGTHLRRRYHSIDELSSESVIVRFVDTKLRVRANENKIVEVEREEVIRKIVLLQPDLLAVSSDIQTYDADGFPTDRKQTVEFRKRDRKFVTVNQSAGINLLSSFTKYLETHQMIDRVPEVR